MTAFRRQGSGQMSGVLNPQQLQAGSGGYGHLFMFFPRGE